MEGDLSTATLGSRRQAPLDESKKDFWDSFGAPAESSSRPSAIGTSAMKGMGGGGGAGGVSGGGGAAKKDEDWEKW